MSESISSNDLITFSDENFEAEVIGSDVPVLVDFWAPWCGPCRTVGPTIEELAGDFQGRAKVGKLNVDENQGVAGALRIMSIPTVAVFHKNKVVDHRVGALSKADYSEMLENAISGMEA